MTHRNGRKKDDDYENEPRPMWRLGETIFWNEAEYQAELRRRAGPRAGETGQPHEPGA